MGSLGGSATLQWNIVVKNSTYKYFSANLISLGTGARTLYILDPNTQQLTNFGAEEFYGNRVSAIIEGGNTCLFKLKNLNYSDENSFKLEIVLRPSDAEPISGAKSAVIKLIVEGKEHLMIYYSCS